jgi:preprotein translocase subunit SecG
MGGLYTLFTVLIIIASVLLILVVLVQNSKGGGLAANFSSSNQVMGVRKTADFLEKSTWTLIIGVFLFSLLASASIRKGSNVPQSKIQNQIDRAIDPSQVPNLPTALPQENPPAEDQNNN